jgi:NAD(P)-dependent dehydrogenase (short-subunit alcohol dehydrogenase family)
MIWTTKDIPNQHGRTSIVTGANSGIGFHAAKELAAAGCSVIMACRNMAKAEMARDVILAEHPQSDLHIMELNLADLESVERFHQEFSEQHQQLDLLVNNAGVMIPPYTKTAQGFELQFGTNHLGHFALTARLMPTIVSTPGSRVVTVASTAHRIGTINFDDLQSEKRYVAWSAYGQSKLANLLFCFELQRRLEKKGHDVRSVAAHPGYAHTALSDHTFFIKLVSPIAGQSAAQGSWPTLRAATDPDAKGGSYWGPKHLFELRGPPVKVNSTKPSKSLETAQRLWAVSEELTGLTFTL